MKKAQINQILVIILVGIIFVTILIFGYHRINDVNNLISNKEIIEYKKQFKAINDYCNEPLNNGNIKKFIIKNKNIDMICLIGKDYNTYSLFNNNNNIDNIKILYDEHNQVFFANSIKKDDLKFEIIESLSIGDYKGKSICFKSLNNKINIRIKCQN